MKTKNILFGAVFLFGGYLMIDYFSKKKTSNVDLGLKEFESPEPVLDLTDIRSVISKEEYLKLKRIESGSPVVDFDMVFTPEDIAKIKENLSGFDWTFF